MLDPQKLTPITDLGPTQTFRSQLEDLIGAIPRDTFHLFTSLTILKNTLKTMPSMPANDDLLADFVLYDLTKNVLSELSKYKSRLINKVAKFVRVMVLYDDNPDSVEELEGLLKKLLHQVYSSKVKIDLSQYKLLKESVEKHEYENLALKADNEAYSEINQKFQKEILRLSLQNEILKGTNQKLSQELQQLTTDKASLESIVTMQTKELQITENKYQKDLVELKDNFLCWMAEKDKQHEEDYQRLRELEIAVTCPLTLQPFKSPVLTDDGFVYEEREIKEWIKKKGTSPLTSMPISENVRPVITLKNVPYWKVNEGDTKC